MKYYRLLGRAFSLSLRTRKDRIGSGNGDPYRPAYEPEDGVIRSARNA
jgi:hypothetical protein